MYVATDTVPTRHSLILVEFVLVVVGIFVISFPMCSLPFLIGSGFATLVFHLIVPVLNLV